MSDVKHAKKDIECLSGEVMALQDILNRVKDLAEGPDAAMLPVLVHSRRRFLRGVPSQFTEAHLP